MPDRDQLLRSATRLHDHLKRSFLREGLLEGPDAGVRYNLRAGRFLKSALDFLPWRDRYVFMQTQGYWILSNWLLGDITGDEEYRRLAVEAAEAVRRLQTPEGGWLYPLPERRHLIATVEGNWAAIGLLATYERTGREDFIKAVIRWHDFLVNRIGFQSHSQGEAINYFDRPRGKVPNNSVEAAWFFLRLWKAAGNEKYRAHVPGMMRFLADVQLPSGELPYVVESPYERGREHYLCFQYNAFQFMKLAWSARLDPQCGASNLLPALAAFLKRGVAESGASAADCFRSRPEVDYYTAALGAALCEASHAGIQGARELSERCYARVLARQRKDGSFAYSEGDYGILRDGRSYPRPQAMTLFHLLLPCAGGDRNS
ncbi:MAG TPA: hypothetical protein VFZ08_03260 [Terriglobia bacterium]|nr:hypothetical protein [Terriglobia bacterium]